LHDRGLCSCLEGHTVDAQVKQLGDAGAEKIFRETASEAKTDRRELAKAVSLKFIFTTKLPRNCGIKSALRYQKV